jgi:hypothetical protein
LDYPRESGGFLFYKGGKFLRANKIQELLEMLLDRETEAGDTLAIAFEFPGRVKASSHHGDFRVESAQ